MDYGKILDDAKQRLEIETDYQLWKKTGIPKSRLSDYRKGIRHLDAYACARLAEVLDLDPFELLAQVEAATEKNEARRTYWKQVAERMAAGSVAAFFVIGLMPGEAQKAGDCNIPNPVIFRTLKSALEKLALRVVSVTKQFIDGHVQGARQAQHRVGRHAPGLIHVTA